MKEILIIFLGEANEEEKLNTKDDVAGNVRQFNEMIY